MRQTKYIPGKKATSKSHYDLTHQLENEKENRAAELEENGRLKKAWSTLQNMDKSLSLTMSFVHLLSVPWWYSRSSFDPRKE